MAIRALHIGAMVFIGIALSLVVQAATQKIIIDIHGNFVMNGKNISVIGMGTDSISFNIDGVIENVFLDKTNSQSTNVNGVHIQIIALSISPAKAVLNVTVNINCGNNACEVGEDFTICCADCGCSTVNQVCVNNRCLENITLAGARNQCYVGADCEDRNSCTTERCDTSEFPNKCVRTDVTACVAGDKCCPKMCDTDQDADCTQVDKCETNANCADSEACTQETCVGTPKRCQYTSQDGCTYENVCIVRGVVKEGKYCEGKSHEWLSQKVDTQLCTEDFECLTAICDSGSCGRSKSETLQYAFYTIGLLAAVMVIWYVSLTRRSKPSQPSSGQL